MAIFLLLLSSCFLLKFDIAAGLSKRESHDVYTRSDDVPALQETVMKQGQVIAQLQAKVTSLEARLDTDDQLVVFMVSVPSSQSLAAHQRLHFGDPDVNVGGGFHAATSSFVAPVSGLYVFFLKVTGQPDGNYLNLSLKKDGVNIADTETNDNDNADRTSVQVITHVKQGQSVWVEKMGGSAKTVIGGGVLSTLGGYLLRAGDHF